jgi:hypothetical protein
VARAPVTQVLTTRRRVPQTLGGSDGWSPAAAVAPKAPPTTILGNGNGNDPGRAEQSERDSAHQAEATSYRKTSFRFRDAICTKQRVDTEFGTDLKLPSEF